MLEVAPGRCDRGFTMLELIVSVGLMVVLLSVLAFVFRQSAEAVSQATEAVNTVQKARNFEARLGRELAAAVQYVAEDTASGKPERAFWFDGDGAFMESQGNPSSAGYTTSIEFVSRTMQDGVMKTWDVKYVFVKDTAADGSALDYGAIRRKKDVPNTEGEYVLWDLKDSAAGGSWDDTQDEILAWPVRGVQFEAAGNWRPIDTAGDQNTELPPYVRARMVFLDTWGGENFELPLEFYFPVYQGD
ncbi:MAG: PulJ/GspJ family protein [Planctomycetota bacterium]|jgi:prepilin-type N-terminal cleavage/methylation domain-containing protein